MNETLVIKIHIASIQSPLKITIVQYVIRISTWSIFRWNLENTCVKFLIDFRVFFWNHRVSTWLIKYLYLTHSRMLSTIISSWIWRSTRLIIGCLNNHLFVNLTTCNMSRVMDYFRWNLVITMCGIFYWLFAESPCIDFFRFMYQPD